MRITSSGYVGIGQDDPTANLEVVGTMKILSSLTGKVGYSTGIQWYFPQ